MFVSEIIMLLCSIIFYCFLKCIFAQLLVYNGQSYDGPFQDVIGEGDVSSVVLPDGTVQMFFIPASSAAQCKRCSQNAHCNTCWNNNPHNNGIWFIRSVNNPNLGRPQPYGSPNYFNPNDRMALPPCPGFQPNQGLKFHNDRCTSTEDIGYFCPRMQQKYDEQEQSAGRDKPCCPGVVCQAPCKCPSNCVGIQPPIYQGFLTRNDSAMSVDEPRRGQKRKKRNVDCACVSVCSINCRKNRKRQKRKYSDSSSSESSDESYKERKKWEKACKKQCKKLEKERQKREKERQKWRKQLEKEEKKLKEKEEEECRKREKHDAKKTDSCACTDKTDSCACSYDKQKGDTPPVGDTDPQSDPCNKSDACSSLLCRLGSAISNMMSTCASSSSTGSSCSTDTCESSNSKLANEELRKYENVLTECERESKKSRQAEKKRLKKEIKELEAEEKKSEKELIKRIAKEQKLQEKERKKREHEQRKRQKDEQKLKQLSASKNEKTTCSCSTSKKPGCFEDPCVASLQNDYGKGDKDTKHKTQSDRIRPLSTQNYPSPYPCPPERQYSKDTKYKARSDCACGGASKQSSSLANCSCTDSAMSIDTKNYSGDSEIKCKRRDLKIIDISEDPCKDVGADCKGPTMANKQLATCGDALEVSQRNCGVLCEGPPTANKQSATHAVQSSCGVFANIMDKLGIGVPCCSTALPPPPPCSTASSKVSFACDRDNNNIGSCAHRNPSCNPL